MVVEHTDIHTIEIIIRSRYHNIGPGGLWILDNIYRTVDKCNITNKYICTDKTIFPGPFTQISMSSKFMSGAVLERGAKPNSGSPKQWV